MLTILGSAVPSFFSSSVLESFLGNIPPNNLPYSNSEPFSDIMKSKTFQSINFKIPKMHVSEVFVLLVLL